MTTTAIPDLIDTFIGFLSLEFIDRQKHQLEWICQVEPFAVVKF
ncbi:hypothetical protein C789_1800 [Microcystis aeruginosa FACHB-905 = DIANCHI905]|uniref:Uncharacterized protein n=1 Tax=Microcystis aeruginosa PCC 7806SL TaxID=1903187 RepID=A0AB33C2N0_MICA7|nr:hypothetical protein BH695_3478 [Microcystis aeruginosa PCC 7806SL]ELS48407.1 hypothetical protein C789_1800 [Microcystis aeruginosa FACHB-905 = DIANCHI905]